MTDKSTIGTNGEATNGPDPSPLASALGVELIQEIVASFVDFLETAVAVFERDGTQIGKMISGDRCSDLLLEADGGGGAGEADHRFYQASREILQAALESGRRQEATANGMNIIAQPVIARDEAAGAVAGAVVEAVIGAIIGVVPEAPTDEQTVKQSARRHLARLAATLGRLYEGAIEDIERRRRLDRHVLELEAINKIVNTSSRTLNQPELLNRAALALSDVTCAEVIAFYLLDAKGGVLTLEGSSMEADEQVRSHVASFKVGEGVIGRAAATGKVEVVLDIAKDARVKKAGKNVAAGHGMNSLLAMPIKVRGQVMGVLSALAPSPEICSEEQIRFIELLSDQLGIAIQNSHLFGEVEETGWFMKSLLDSMAEAAYTCDLHRNFTYLNAASKNITGYEPQELIGKNVNVLIPEDQMEKLQEMIIRRNEGLVDRYDMDLVRKDGERVTINQTVSPLYAGQAVIGLVGVAFDITESMKLRSRLEQQNQRLGLLQSIMAKSVSRLTRGKALKTLVYEIADTFGYDFCNIFMPAADGAKLQIVASHGYTGEFVEQLNNGDLLDLNDADFIKTPVGRAFRDGIQTVMTDVAKDSPYARLKEGVKTQGFSSIVATPLGFRGERLGAMTVCTKDPHEFDREELNLLSTIAAQAAVIAGSAGIYNRLAQSEQRFRELYNSAADWMYMLDENGLIIECNDTMVQGLETSRDDVIGSHIYDWEAEGDREKAMAALAGFREKSEPGMFFASERTFVSGKGNRLVLGLHGRAMPDTKGGGLQWRMIGRDITAEHRMTTEILRRNRELAVLNAVAATASASLDLDSTLQASLISVIESMKYDVGVIFLLDPEKNELTPRVSSGAPGDMLATISHVKVGEGYAGRIAATREPYFTDDTPENPFQLPYVPKSPWFTSLGGVPVIARDKLLGVVIFATGEHHQFDEAEQALLASVGKTIGVAIENARLFDDVVRSKNEWEATFDAMTNGVSIHSQDHTIIRANRALAGLLGTTTGDLVGKKCYEVFHGINEPILICPQEKVFKDGKSHSIIAEEPYLGRVLNISSDPVFDVDGNIKGIVHDVRDITEQEQLREQLAHSDKIRALGELAGGVAHDFNNFLSVILGNTQLLLSQIGNERWDGESRESLESIKRAATDAAETVRRIQEFTRVRTTRSFTAVDINRVIQHAIDVARPRWHDEAVARGVNIDIKTELGEIPPVNANESELGEVFVNLLINAADALPDGGVITLATDANAQAERVRAIISDTGEGMEEDVRRRIFDPFYSTKGVGGSGLGLSVAYGIINRHGGDITVESQKGAGTRFTVSLPVVTASDLAAAMEPEATLPLVRPARILVIDDAPMIRSLLGEILEQMGHSFEVAGSGAAGLELFDTAVTAGEPFDVVLTDLGMPVMSGWEVVDAVKRRSPQTPVALITGWGDQLDPEKMQQSAVDAVIAKPFKVEDIRGLLAKALA